MTDSENRRESDAEAFKYQIVAQQAEMKTKIDLMYDMVKLQLDDHKTRIINLEKVVIGKDGEPGLAEKNRNVAKDVAKIFVGISITGAILWKVISPMYDAWVNRWASQNISTSTQPEPKSSKILRKSVPVKN